MKKCLNPACERGQRSRGLCINCYQAALRLVRQGRTTWKHLEQMGKVLPPAADSRSSGPISKWLLEDQEIPKS